MKLIVPILILLPLLASPDEDSRLDVLHQNYQLAVERATKPITATYIGELKKLKTIYTKAGNLEMANQTQKMLDSAMGVKQKPEKLSDMSEEDFAEWLSGVEIEEQEGPFKLRFTFEDGEVHSYRPGTKSPRVHADFSIKTGRVMVPFSSTNATIEVDNDLKSAKVSYSSGGMYAATVSAKK